MQGELRFDGTSYDPEHDGVRLRGQLGAVYACMAGGVWRTIPEIGDRVPEASDQGISARLRDLRKPRFGGFLVEKRRRGDPGRGVWEYRLRLVRGSTRAAPERLTHRDMRACLEVLRGIYSTAPMSHQAALMKLVRWLDANADD